MDIQKHNSNVPDKYKNTDLTIFNDSIKQGYWETIHPTTYSEVVKGRTPQFSKIIDIIGKEESVAISILVFHEMLSDMTDFSTTHFKMMAECLLSEVSISGYYQVENIDPDKKVNELRVKETGGYPTFTILDLKLCLKNGILGLYGHYGELKIHHITGVNGWFKQYFEQRNISHTDLLDKKRIAQSRVINNPDAVECPEHLKYDPTKVLSNKSVKFDLPYKFDSLRHFCGIMVYDYDNYIAKLLQGLKIDESTEVSKLEYEQHVVYEKRKQLEWLNQEWSTGGRKRKTYQIMVVTLFFELFVK